MLQSANLLYQLHISQWLRYVSGRCCIGDSMLGLGFAAIAREKLGVIFFLFYSLGTCSHSGYDTLKSNQNAIHLSKQHPQTHQRKNKSATPSITSLTLPSPTLPLSCPNFRPCSLPPVFFSFLSQIHAIFCIPNQLPFPHITSYPSLPLRPTPYGEVGLH